MTTIQTYPKQLNKPLRTIGFLYWLSVAASIVGSIGMIAMILTEGFNHQIVGILLPVGAAFFYRYVRNALARGTRAGWIWSMVISVLMIGTLFPLAFYSLYGLLDYDVKNFCLNQSSPKAPEKAHLLV